MFNMIYNIFSLVYTLIKLLLWIVKMSWNMGIMVYFLHGLYLAILGMHHLCKSISNMDKLKGNKNDRVVQNTQQTVLKTPFNYSSYEDDIDPEDSVSVVSADSFKDSDGSHFENIDSYQVKL